MARSLLFLVCLHLPAQIQAPSSPDGDAIASIMDLARAGDLPGIQRALATSPELIGARDQQGRTLIHWAALGNDPLAMDFLSRQGADINARDLQGETPLHLAARRLRREAAVWLIDHHADLTARNHAGQTPITLAAMQGPDEPEWQSRRTEFIAMLIRAGAAPPDEPTQRPTEPELRDAYHTWPEIETALQNAAANYPAICRRVPLGPTVQGRTLWALCISDNVSTDEDEPEFAYVSTIHGNETLGAELCLYLVDLLTSQYGIDPRISRLVDSLEIWIIPCMNPDGFVAGTRTNAHGVDLNRNFPDPYTSPSNTIAGREPETAHIMNWSFGRSITLSANLHTGTLVVNYPYDANSTGQSVYTACPDDDLFIYISEQYSQHNPPMWNSASFYHGITNGADWYVVYGGMQDWRYVFMGGNEVTIELANSTPPASQLPAYWANNRESMLAYMETCLMGVRGIVRDAQTLQPLAANMDVVGRDHRVSTDPDVGDYHRMALPGTYSLQFRAAGHDPARINDLVVPAGDALRHDVYLWPGPIVLFPGGGETLTVGQPVAVTWSGSPIARFQVQCTYNDGAVSNFDEGFESGSLGSAFATGGTAPWFVTTAIAHSGSRSARSGAISHNQASWLTRTVSGPGQVSFWYQVSSEANYDFFTLTIDGVQHVRASGTVAWTQFATSLGDGPHELKWQYAKDGSLSSGSDLAAIDDLQVTEIATIWADIVSLTAPGATSVMWTPTTPSTSARVRVRSVQPDGEAGEWAPCNGVVQVVPGATLGDLNCDGLIDVGDVDPFCTALIDPAAYLAQYPACSISRADLNEDDQVDGGDIQSFVDILTAR